MAGKSTRPFSSWILALAGGLAFLVLFGAYSGSFHNSFHFDDSHVIESNVYIRSLNNVPKFFMDAGTVSSLPANSNYRPLVSLSLAFDYWMGKGLDPFVFHVTQFSLLVLLGIFVFFLFKHVIGLASDSRWNGYVALFAALTYCLHTVHTETLNIISSRSELLSTLGIVGSFLVYVHAPKWRRYYLYLLPMALGILAKPPAVMFVPLFFVYVFLFEEGAAVDRILPTIKKTLPAFALGLVLFVFVTKMDHPEATYSIFNRWDYALTQPFVWLHYLRLFFLPVGLTADTDWRLLDHWYDTRFFAGLAAIFLLIGLAWKFSKRPQSRPVAFGLAWFLIALAPSSSIIALSEVANEHRVFFPYVGLSLAVTWWLADSLMGLAAKRPKRARLLAVLSGLTAVLALGGLAVGTYERNKVWRTEESLWYDVTLKSPTNGRALMNYGLTQMSQGKYQRAKDYFDKALTFTPYYHTLEVNLGIVNSGLGDMKTAEVHFQRALTLQPRYAEGHFFYARWLSQQKRIDEAIGHLEAALAISPGLSPARELLMPLYESQGQDEKLKKLVQETLALWPEDPTANAFARKMGLK